MTDNIPPKFIPEEPQFLPEEEIRCDDCGAIAWHGIERGAKWLCLLCSGYLEDETSQRETGGDK